ncbi:MAG TPA: hypothetical protein VEX35_05885 [Allosphingosinicella sp.]|nr:hypothetical protein [Allosphingosinicella sp.]
MSAPLLLAALAALAMEAPHPSQNWSGPGFACRMTHIEGGGRFRLSGSFGTGRRFESAAAAGRGTRWLYTFPDARIADSEIGFSGRAMDARTGMVGPPDAIFFAPLSIAYPRTGGGMELIIEGASGPRRPARLQGYRNGERVARGSCTLTPSGAAQIRAEALS